MGFKQNLEDKYELPDSVWGFERGVQRILRKFMGALDSVAHEKHEISAADLVDFADERNKRILFRASGIVSDLTAAYQTATNEYEALVRAYYRVPAETQRQVLKEQMRVLKKQFSGLLKIIRVKAEVAIEDIEDVGLEFPALETLRFISALTFEQVEQSWKDGIRLLYP